MRLGLTHLRLATTFTENDYRVSRRPSEHEIRDCSLIYPRQQTRAAEERKKFVAAGGVRPGVPCVHSAIPNLGKRASTVKS
jgi:hypothetical protein